MTDAELIAGMRARKDAGSKLAADRIEALSAERDRWKDACRSASRDLNIVVPDNDRLKSERDAAEAKLAKAVEALEAFAEFDALPTAVKRPDLFEIKVRKPILRTLAEIKGESHEALPDLR